MSYLLEQLTGVALEFWSVLAEMARVYIRDALKQWLPGVAVTNVSVRRDGGSLLLQVRLMDGSQRQESFDIAIR